VNQPPLSQGLRQSAAGAYLEKEIAGLSPMGLILKIYDVAIAGCNQRNTDRASRALVELIASLNFEYRDMSTQLFRLYEYCMRCVKSGQFDTALKILTELRGAWSQVAKDEMRQAG